MMTSKMSLENRVKLILIQPRLLLNAVLLLIFSAIWLREGIYWFPKDAFGTSLNYWAYTDWLFDYSQGFIRRGLSGEIWRLVPDTVPPLNFVAAISWILILAAVFGYGRLLVRSWKIFHTARSECTPLSEGIDSHCHTPTPDNHPDSRGKFPYVRPIARADHTDCPKNEGTARPQTGLF
jgi:hypothetical protein